MRVRLENADESDAMTLRGRQERVDVIRRVDDERDAGVLVAHEIRGAAQILVQELLEQETRRFTTESERPQRGGAALGLRRGTK